MEEVWKSIPNYEGKYEVSNLGRVKSLNYHREGYEKLMSPQVSKGYLYVLLSKNGKPKRLLVHRIVWIAFKGPIPEGMEINHKDEDKTRNCLDNLELVDRKANCNYGTRNVRMALKLKSVKKPLNGGPSKQVFQYDLDGNYVSVFPSAAEASRVYGFSSRGITKCASGVLKTFKGYKWSYREVV